MATWGYYSNEFASESYALDAIGIEKYKNKPEYSYKQQALRELVMRRHLERVVESMTDEINGYIDKIELLEFELWKAQKEAEG